MKQEFLAEMLRTRRSTVSTIAAAFQRSGLIGYKRGRVRILDRAGLAACACYGHIRQLDRNLYGSVLPSRSEFD